MPALTTSTVHVVNIPHLYVYIGAIIDSTINGAIMGEVCTSVLFHYQCGALRKVPY